MKNGKTPGIDGFPAEFFKVFWGKLKYFILRSALLTFKNGIMSYSLRHCIILCIPKGDKDRTLLKNWRPISLLSVVYKMLSSVIASRIKSVLNQLISPAQTGFLPGQFIGENTRLIYDLLHFTQNENIPGLLVLIDFQKTFDSVAWNFLTEVLIGFNFGPNIRKWVNIFNTDITASVCQYGHLSEKLKIERGCRQGDPLFVYLFLICAQVLYIMIESNQDIKGISVNGNEIKVTQFADDTTLILNGECGPLQSALNTLEIFGDYSGLIVNTDKTQVIWIGKKRGSKTKLNIEKNLKWGLNFSTDLVAIPNLNYSVIVDEIPKRLNFWNQRYTTPLGRINILKTLILPKFIHLFTVLLKPPASDIKKINSMFYKFIWNNKPDKIKRTIINKPYHQGGLKMIDLGTFIEALQLTWVKRFFADSGSQWSTLTEYNIGSKRKNFDMGSLWHQNLKKNVSNKFYYDLLTSWQQILEVTTISKPMNMPLWYTHLEVHFFSEKYVLKWLYIDSRCV